MVSRIDNLILQLFSGAEDTALPPWPAAVSGPRDGESVGDALLRLRQEISIAQGEVRRARMAPPPVSEIKAAIAAEIERLADGGTPRITIDSGRVTIHWPDVMMYAVPGAALSAPSGSASKMLAALFPAELKKLLTAGIVDTKGAIPSGERPQRIRDAEASILALEVAEERLVCEALDAGLEVHRRIDANPWAILNADVEAAQAAEAAE